MNTSANPVRELQAAVRQRDIKDHERDTKRYREFFWFWQVVGWAFLAATGLYWLIVGSPPPIGTLAAGTPTFCLVLSAVWWLAARNEQKKANELKPPLTEEKEREAFKNQMERWLASNCKLEMALKAQRVAHTEVSKVALYMALLVACTALTFVLASYLTPSFEIYLIGIRATLGIVFLGLSYLALTKSERQKKLARHYEKEAAEIARMRFRGIN
jgi:Flp pilus assembly protein TadB